MREILFKAKRIATGEWVEGYYIYHIKRTICPFGDSVKPKDEQHVIMHDGFSDWNMPRDTVAFEIDPETLCQYTGLTDKNGRKIWENDVVDGHTKRGAAFWRSVVLWNECKARFDVRTMDCSFPMTLDEDVNDISVSGLDYVVIGNIFDNPELLEVEK